MSRFTSKQQLVDDIIKERKLLEDLLEQIPNKYKEIEITNGMSVKDFLAHRTEWGRMMIDWYTQMLFQAKFHLYLPKNTNGTS